MRFLARLALAAGIILTLGAFAGHAQSISDAQRGDIEKIIAAKRADTAFLFFTDGLTWRERKSDLRKIVEYQNSGDITRIYTHAMADRFEADLRKLKAEYHLL